MACVPKLVRYILALAVEILTKNSWIYIVLTISGTLQSGEGGPATLCERDSYQNTSLDWSCHLEYVSYDEASHRCIRKGADVYASPGDQELILTTETVTNGSWYWFHKENVFPRTDGKCLSVKAYEPNSNQSLNIQFVNCSESLPYLCKKVPDAGVTTQEIPSSKKPTTVAKTSTQVGQATNTVGVTVSQSLVVSTPEASTKQTTSLKPAVTQPADPQPIFTTPPVTMPPVTAPTVTTPTVTTPTVTEPTIKLHTRFGSTEPNSDNEGTSASQNNTQSMILLSVLCSLIIIAIIMFVAVPKLYDSYKHRQRIRALSFDHRTHPFARNNSSRVTVYGMDGHSENLYGWYDGRPDSGIAEPVRKSKREQQRGLAHRQMSQVHPQHHLENQQAMMRGGSLMSGGYGYNKQQPPQQYQQFPQPWANVPPLHSGAQAGMSGRVTTNKNKRRKPFA